MCSDPSSVYVQSELITGYFPVSVCPELPIEGISFLMGNDIVGGKVTPSLEVLNAPQRLTVTVLRGLGTDAPVGDRPSLPMSRAHLSEPQKADLSLKKCFSKVVCNSNTTDKWIAYYMQEDLLMRKWSPSVAADAEWSVVCQVVVPAE